jgi:carboxyl-terminal processing protease
VKQLQDQDVIFNYVTQQCIGRDSIGPLESFQFNDFAGFLSFLDKSNFKFETETDKMLRDLKEMAAKETYSPEVTAEIDQLKAIVEKEKSTQVKKHEKEILRAIEKEMLSRYYFETGLVRHQLKNDPELAEAISILNNPATYTGTLKMN